MSLFMWARVVACVHEDEKEGHHECDEGEDGGQPQSEVVKSVSMPYRCLGDDLVFECGIALGPAHVEIGFRNGVQVIVIQSLSD